MAASEPLTIWYNTLCPVCTAGITWQKRLLVPALKAGHVRFENINDHPDALGRFDAALEDIRKRLHATTGEDALLIGGDVVIAVMRMTPGQRWLAPIIGNPVMRPVTNFVYDRIADLLYAWNRRKGHW
ncbi:MAG: DCC1-like thiol-disulfide oxidoreductase family protein [Pseudomonadota bacterium]